ncbi:hypothetical protein ANN_02259 [Periplaneta americana]|uniref:Uncharacterized protein n=1 Tax=Periplaneta americana TaxID=6978 RepID=A0ABQ8TY98_PERAM|nr:hypothetical protein ANN_02259 [Periplaneta americana]
MAGLCEGGNEPPGSLKASFIKQVYQPPLPPTIEDLRVRITEAIALVDGQSYNVYGRKLTTDLMCVV